MNESEVISDRRRRTIIFCLIPAMTLPFAGAYLYFVVLSGSPWAPKVYTCIKLFTLCFPLIAVVWFEKQKLRSSSRGIRAHLEAVPLGILSGLVIAALVFVVYGLTPLGDIIRDNSGRVVDRVRGLGVLDMYVPFCAFLAILHSLIEEYYWRWYVFDRLTKVVRPSAAYIIGGIGFAAHHYVLLWNFFPPSLAIFLGTAVGVGGAYWSWQFLRQKSLLGCWVSHCLVDVAIFIVGYKLIHSG